MLLAGLGPELSVPMGRARAYATATGGLARVWASSTLHQDGYTPGGGAPFHTETGTHATNVMWSGGGGVAIPVSSARTGAMLDIGIRYYDAGSASYMQQRLNLSVPGGADVYDVVRHRTTFIAPSVGLVLHP